MHATPPSFSDAQQALWTPYVYYVVMLCPCGHSYYHPSRRQIRLDTLTPEHLSDEIRQIPLRLDTRCSECGRQATPFDARRAVLGYGFPDRSGCILCDFLIEDGEVQRTRFRFDATPDPIDFFREHPDYFRTRPPDNSPLVLDDELCIQEVGRVLSVRSSWEQVLQRAMEVGAAFMTAHDGTYLFATTSQESHEIECQMNELADESFWYYFQHEEIPRRRLIGIDRWNEEQREQSGLSGGDYSRWLSPPIVDALQQGKLHALAFSIDSVALQHMAEAAIHYEVEIDEVSSHPDEPPQWWIRNASGLSRPFPSLELLQLTAIYKGMLIGDLIWLTFKKLTQSLSKEERVFERLYNRLPPGFSAEWADPGKLMICHGDRPLELLTFAHIADNIDPNDDDALSRLVSWLVSKKGCECSRYVGKRLMSKNRFHECLPEFAQHPDAFIYRERTDNLVEIYTDECEHHVIYGLKTANGDVQRAEALFQRDLSMQRYALRYIVRRSFLRGVQMVAVVGRDAASIAANAALLRGLVDDLNVRLGDRVRVFSPFNGILTLAPPTTTAEKLEKFAYELARELPEEPELKSDHLGYHALLDLADDPIGQFKLEEMNSVSRG